MLFGYSLVGGCQKCNTYKYFRANISRKHQCKRAVSPVNGPGLVTALDRAFNPPPPCQLDSIPRRPAAQGACLERGEEELRGAANGGAVASRHEHAHGHQRVDAAIWVLLVDT